MGAAGSVRAVQPRRIYLDGNSLGPPGPGTAQRLASVVDDEWGGHLIGGWNDCGWWDLPVTVGDKIAPLIGAAPGQVVAADSTTIMWHKVVAAALALVPERSTILTQTGGFPTDRHVIDAVAALAGARVVAVTGDELLGAITPEVGVVAVTHVDYRSGERHDLSAVTAAAHAVGAVMVWDLSHSVGAMDLHLDDAGVDLAVGCTYKYLNGGPGSPAFAYAASRHHQALRHPLVGWVGHADPFSMDERHEPAHGIRRLLSGTPPVLGLRCLEMALERFDGVDLHELRAHSLALTGRAMELADERLLPPGFEVVAPRDPQRRGSQVSLRHPEAWAVVQAAIEVGVVGDFRPPDLCRLGFAPLYLALDDVEEAIDRIVGVMTAGTWQRWRDAGRPAVT
jgi:kynureninase